MALQEKIVAIRFKAGPLVEKEIDGEKQMVPGEPIPTMHATLRELGPLDAMNADDIAYEMAAQQNREPSRPRILKTYALCAVTAIDGEPVPKINDVARLSALAARLGAFAVDTLTNQFLAFGGEIATMTDPKDSPDGSPSAP